MRYAVWPRRSDSLLVGLSDAQVAWQYAGSAPQTAPLPVPGGQYRADASLLEMPGLPSRLAAVHLVAGSSVARHWLQAAPRGLRSLSELRDFVQSRAEQLFGAAPGWIVAADWHASRPFLCSALRRDVDLFASELALSRSATRHLSTSLGLALAQFARRLPVDGWAAVHEPQALHALYFSGGELGYLRTTVVAPNLDEVEFEREALTEIARSSALAGGLPKSPVTILSMSVGRGATQDMAALSLLAPPLSDRPS